ncbi:hypothetical protein M041_gp80 [Mycobacterium phage Severus]|uniref:hypothetical protein n=1 Tax=Mycobacterium phage Severus TaxID=1327776 RepID=UPI00032B5A4F|nr:hypothetical protein M041_gp80 [Mycobacterium phage Severus]YP_009124925.1 hypothetical protein VC70_gp65 [Mycobacterium phage Trike]AVO22408.1 hypothetical protein SEA_KITTENMITTENS_7 [Mycobacterium phage KittenMittens]QWS69291.1 hypothetical protein SEA_PEACEMEAL1_7 [Mycobacterium Phage PeaceMeal1]QZD96991.1 hypothetical protein SEA_DRAKE94_7 [Mycobacterium phage Drake94]USL89141.1 hypothetical protein SEA_POOMPHA_7 [Mycobacterium phage Poompha]AGK87939.1 hypothetical protein PBI_SEVERUS
MGFLQTIGKAVGEIVVPVIQRELKEHAETLIPQVLDSVRSEFDKQLPALTKALVTAVTEAAAKGAAEGADRITDAIPGQLDDQIIDPIVNRALEIFRGALGR